VRAMPPQGFVLSGGGVKPPVFSGGFFLSSYQEC
jgi:hypothetical protein